MGERGVAVVDQEPGDRAFLALSVGGYALLTAVFLAPLLLRFSTHLTPDFGDPLFNLTILSWVGERLLEGGAGLWSPSFFHPAERVLTYSDHLLGPGLVFGLLRRAGATPAAAYNSLLVASFILSGSVACWVVRRAGQARFAAFLGGALLAFAPYKWDQLSHLQMLLSPWIPAVLWCWHRFLEKPDGRRAAPFLVFYALHMLGGNYLAYLLHIPLALMWLARAAELSWRERASTVAAGGVAACVALAVLWPYAAGAEGVQAARMSSDFRAWGATLASFFTASPSWGAPRLQPLAPPLRAENGLFIGLPFLLLAALGGWLFWWRHRAPTAPLTSGQRRSLLALGLAALAAYAAGDVITWWPGAPARLRLGLSYSVVGLVFVASTGLWLVLRHRWGAGWPLRFQPGDRWQRALALTGVASFLVAHPLIFRPLSLLLPGMDRMRVPTRIFPILLVPLCCLAAAGAAEIVRRAGKVAPRRLAAAAVLLVALADLAPISLVPYLIYLPRRHELPAVYRWLESAPDVDAILELPIYADHGELEYQYAWLTHRKPLLNGYSGLFPDRYQRLHQTCQKRRAASLECLDEARRMGASHVVYHSGALLFDKSRRRQRRQPDSGTGVALVYEDSMSRVYRLRDELAGEARQQAPDPGLERPVEPAR